MLIVGDIVQVKSYEYCMLNFGDFFEDGMKHMCSKKFKIKTITETFSKHYHNKVAFLLCDINSGEAYDYYWAEHCLIKLNKEKKYMEIE